MKYTLYIAVFLLLSAPCTSHAQDAKEVVTSCFNEHINPNQWSLIISYFETYLTEQRIRQKGQTIEEAYLEFLRFRAAIPAKKLPWLPDRETLKETMIKAGIIPSGSTYGNGLIECYVGSLKKIKGKPKPYADIAKIFGEVKAHPFTSPSIPWRKLAETLDKKDLKLMIYKKTVILAAFSDVVYLEEIATTMDQEVKKEAEVALGIRKKTKLESSTNMKEDKIAQTGIQSKLGTGADEDVPPGEKVWTMVQIPPKFPGGNIEIDKYFQKMLKYPPQLQGSGKHGMVYVKFIVEKDGRISNVKVTKGLDPLIDQEVQRVIVQMPNWEPGKQAGVPVRVSKTMPVKFAPD